MSGDAEKQPNFITKRLPKHKFSNLKIFFWNLRYSVWWARSVLNFCEVFCLSGYSVSSS